MKLKALLCAFFICAAPLAAPAMELEDTSWLVQAFNNGKQAVQSLLPGTKITADFGEGGCLSGSAGCNRYTASYVLKQGKIKIGPAATTRMFCSNPPGIMEQEALFLRVLEKSASFSYDGETLFLHQADGAIAVMLTGGAAYIKESATQAEQLTITGEWIVESIGGKTIQRGRAVTMTFAGDGSVTGKASVNRYFAGWIAAGDMILVTGGGTSMMAGAPELMEQEALFLGTLKDIRRYRLDGGKLYLLKGDGSQALVLRPGK